MGSNSERLTLMSAPTTISWLAVVAYILLFFAIAGGTLILRGKWRHQRPPERFKLLRGPGESQRRRAHQIEESLLYWMIGTAMAPLLIASLLVQTLPALGGSLKWAQLGVIAIVFVGGLALSGIVLYRRLSRWRNERLGYLGERSVAERLDPLVRDGYRIFHDVPAEGRRKDFNLDHVVVGPTGVSVIETKTYRKRRGIPGRKEHEILFDGRKVEFPWRDGTDEIRQTVAAAEWLRGWLKQRLGQDIAVKPILAFPGWFVKESPSKDLRVVNAKILPDVIRGRDIRVLSDDQIDLIARQLESICRDVED